MRALVLGVVACLIGHPVFSQTEADYKVYTEHPRLLLTKNRLRLLKRERERTSFRWTQLDTLISGGARMTEPAFAYALYAAVTGDKAAAAKAVAAVQPNTSLREAAVVADWTRDLIDPGQLARLQDFLVRGLKTRTGNSVAAIRDRTFAALAVDDAAALHAIVQTWWRKEMAPGLIAGTRRIAPEEAYPLLEILHVIRDNFQIELRDDALPFFKLFPASRIMEYYPATYPAAENEYRIPMGPPGKEPDLRLATMSRAADLALVAYEANATDTQFLQGWLLQDRFALRNPLGAPYEFFWANPYQPGLPFEKMSLRFEDAAGGVVILRSSWEEDALWVRLAPQNSQMFSAGAARRLDARKPLQAADAQVVAASAFPFLEIVAEPEGPWFLIGLDPNSNYVVETDDEYPYEARTDRAGTLKLEFTRRDKQKVFWHKPAQIPQKAAN